MKIIFDEYVWKARILVAVLVSLPVLTIIPWITSHFQIAHNPIFISSVVMVACALLASTIVRQLGVFAEKKLIKDWGGLPSTLIMRWRDDAKSDQYKIRIHELVQSKLGIQFLSKEEEMSNPDEADKRIQDAFGRIKSIIWGKSTLPSHADNIDYGFNRNLYGSRWIWIFFCVLSIMVLIMGPYLLHETIPMTELFLSMALLITIIIVEWGVIKKQVRHCAFRYAEHAWSALEDI